MTGGSCFKAKVTASETYNTSLEKHLRTRLGLVFAERPGTDRGKRPVREVVGVEPARATRPKACKLATHPRLRAIVEEKLAQRWSPQQIAGWLKRTYPEDPRMQVSHESIYRTLYVQSRGALRKELTRYLRTGRVIRRPKGVRTARRPWRPGRTR